MSDGVSGIDIVWWKPFAAAASGRALTLLQAKRGEPITWQKVLGIVIYEPALIAGFGFLGWHAFAHIPSEDIRLTATLVIAWAGQRGVELILSRFLPPVLSVPPSVTQPPRGSPE